MCTSVQTLSACVGQQAAAALAPIKVPPHPCLHLFFWQTALRSSFIERDHSWVWGVLKLLSFKHFLNKFES